MRYEVTGKRDLAYSLWHRAIPDDNVTMIDIDSVEYCNICFTPLSIIEHAEGNQFSKPYMVTKIIAERLGIPAYVVLYKKKAGKIVQFNVRQVAPIENDWKRYEPEEFANFLIQIHRKHIDLYHKPDSKKASLTNLSRFF
ncbi:MAG: hypothetical protein QXQ33_00730 [Nitrososphaerota archaeon]